MVRLAKVSVDFPEISQHLRSGLPPELLEVWNPNRTLTFFNSHQVCPFLPQRNAEGARKREPE